MKRIASQGLWLVLLCGLSLGQSMGAGSPKFEALDAAIAREVSSNGVGGVTVGVLVGPDLVWTNSYGQADK